MGTNTENTPSPCKFASIAVLDLETSNLPSINNNRTKITELCIYGFAADLLEAGSSRTGTFDGSATVPETPRVLHKLTLLFNPQIMIHPDSERITGLSNYILEQESLFDENAGNTMLGFLQHLQQPLCLVAHNGWAFDFPLVKQALEKLQKNLPSNMVCVDSLRAFLEIDKKRESMVVSSEANNKVVEVKEDLEKTPKTENTIEEITILSDSSVEADMLLLTDALTENSQFNWRAFNESTPKRTLHETTSVQRVPRKRKLFAESIKNVSACTANSAVKERDFNLSKSCCSLHFGPDASPIVKKYPPRGVYKLGNIYRRIFKQSPKHAHHAEADVKMLMQLVLHYGVDFKAYAGEHARPLSEVPKLGRY